MPIDKETLALIAQVADKAAHKAVVETLLTMGIDTHDPLETQRDMAALRELRDMLEDEEFQADLLHIRKWRQTMDSVEKKGVVIGLTLIFLGGLAFMLLAMKHKLFGFVT